MFSMLMRLMVLLCVPFLAATAALSRGPSPDEMRPMVKLTTLWDAPGQEFVPSPNGLFVVIDNLSTDVSRLVSIETGEILAVARNHFFFSPSSEFFVYIENSTGEYALLNVLTHEKFTLPGRPTQFSPDENYLMIDADMGAYKPKFIVETADGEIILEYDGAAAYFNPASDHVVLHDRTNPSRIISTVVDLKSQTTVTEFINTSWVQQYGDGWSIISPFSPDNSLLAIYYGFSNTSQIFDTNTWEMLYETTGQVVFSPDSQYIATGDMDGYADVALLNARTGEVLDSYIGGLRFSPDSRYMFRSETTFSDRLDFRLIELASGDTAFAGPVQTGTFPQLDESNRLELWLTASPPYRYIELSSHKALRSPAQTAYFRNQPLIQQEAPSRLIFLRNWQTRDDVIASRYMIKLDPTNTYAFVSNGLYVDVYGPPDRRVDTMPPPSPPGGFGSITCDTPVTGTRPACAAQNANINAPPVLVNVLGRDAAGERLFIRFEGTWLDHGWVQADQITPIVPWDNVPVLDPNHPIDDLRRIAES